MNSPGSSVHSTKNGGKTKYELDKEFAQAKIDALRTREAFSQMQLLRERGELISRDAVLWQASILLTAFRQHVLSWVASIAPRLEKPLADSLREQAHQWLRDLAELPIRLEDPEYLAQIEDEFERQQKKEPSSSIPAPQGGKGKSRFYRNRPHR